jgi:hypothetical protein
MISQHENLKRTYGPLFDEVSAALYAADPVGVNTGGNVGEYDREAGTILPRLENAHSADNVQVLVHDAFCHAFGGAKAGDIGRYEDVSELIWEAWLRYGAKRREAR